MIIQEEKWRSCESCGSHIERVQEKEYGCDTCRKHINENYGQEREYLRLVVFAKTDNSGAKDYQFCSWKCVFKKLRTLKTDYFVSLPYLHFDSNIKGQRASDFLKCLKVSK